MEKDIRDDFKIALEVGIDTTGGIETLEAAKLMEGIKAVSSDDFKTFQSAVEQINEKSQFVTVDSLDGLKER